MYFPCLFLYNVPCDFDFVIRFCYETIVVLLLTFFINFLGFYSIEYNVFLLLDHYCS